MDSTLSSKIEARASELFASERDALARQTDRMMAWLMVGQWAAGIAAALWISPLAWAGATSTMHIHVYAAAFLGALIAAFPAALVALRPGRVLTRHVVAAGQMLMSALLIHLSGGRIETHFHVFGSLALLAFYRDIPVLITASAVVAIDHLLRGMFWPQSVFGVLVASPWRALEHAGWVVFEDSFLIISIRRSLRATRETAEKRAQIESAQELTEAEVRLRTRKLQESEERFRSLSASSPVGIYETQADGRPVYVNAGWCEITGLSEEQGLGRGWVAALHEDDRPSVLARWNEAVEAGHFSAEYRMWMPNGTLRWVHSQAAAVRESDGAIRSWVGTLENITERKQAEESLVRGRQAAEEAARLKSEFVANMSHEIRTPINGIMGMTELALQTDLNDEQRDYLETVRYSSDALLTVINDILDFSKIEAGRLDIESIPFGLRDCLGEGLKTFAHRSAERGIEIACHVLPDVPETLMGDPMRLRQVVLNLVSNAIKFTERGEVVVRVREVESSEGSTVLEFSVADTGIGIAPDMQKLIFESFTQADGSTSRQYGGTGLGLAISQRLVAMMGGRIDVESTVGQGSTFSFRLPFALQQRDVDAPLAPIADTLSGYRALVVDDHEINRRIYSETLESQGMNVVAVPTGDSALNAMRRSTAAQTPFDLVLLDCQMPGLNGFDVAAQVRDTIDRDIPILMLTSSGQRGDAARCRELRISGFLTKPIATSQLISVLRSTLGGSPTSETRTVVTRHTLRENAGQLRVLVAEDNLVNRRLAVRLLEKRGHHVTAVEDGVCALAEIARQTFDVILMDVQMPKMDGFKVTAAIRESEQRDGGLVHVPIVALTAHALKSDQERCLAAGMDAYVSKPFKADELLGAIDLLLAARLPKGVSAGEDSSIRPDEQAAA